MRVRWVDGEDSAFDGNSHPFKGQWSSEIPPMSNLVSQRCMATVHQTGSTHTRHPGQELRELIQ